jgi:hypothetical protein
MLTIFGGGRANKYPLQHGAPNILGGGTMSVT